MTARILGDFDSKKKIGLSKGYFEERDCWIDCRGEVEISATANFGWCVKIVSQTHAMSPGFTQNVVSRRVIVKDKAYIGSFAILYNCEIGEGAVVACGAVVRNMMVEPWTMVEGNPARVFKRLNKESGKWVRV